MTEREALNLGQPLLPMDAGEPEDALVAGAACELCHEPGAGSPYQGKLYHLSCRMEVKRDDGLITTIYQKLQPRLRGTGSGKRRKR